MTPNLSWRLGLYAIFGFWAFVALKSFPPPFIDDAWYAGAAINLAQHGVFSNPLCESLATIGSAKLFLAYMPLHSYILAGWLRLFGVSTLSFHVFFTLLAFLDTLLIYWFFPKARSSWAIALLIILAVYELLAGVGMRPDSLGLFFLLIGMNVWRARTVAGYFVGNIFLGLAVITFPTVAPMALMFALAALAYQRLFYGRTLRELIPLLLASGTAYALCFLLFLVCIHGQLGAFLDCLSRNQQMGVAGMGKLFTAVGISKWIVVQAAFLFLIVAMAYQARTYYHRQERWFFLLLALLAFISLGFASCISATGVHVWAFACLIAGLFILVQEDWRWRAWLVYLGIFAVAVFGHGHGAIEQLLARPPLTWGERAALRAEIKSLHPARLYVDAYAMRELYNYRLPPNTYCFETSSTTGWGQPTKADMMPKNAVAVVSVGSAFPTGRSPEAGARGIPLKIFGYVLPGAIQNPYDLEIIDNR